MSTVTCSDEFVEPSCDGATGNSDRNTDLSDEQVAEIFHLTPEEIRSLRESWKAATSEYARAEIEAANADADIGDRVDSSHIGGLSESVADLIEIAGRVALVPLDGGIEASWRRGSWSVAVGLDVAGEAHVVAGRVGPVASREKCLDPEISLVDGLRDFLSSLDEGDTDL